ncbi:hypothetical protein ANCDUO_00830 [Ancylostoma duodenale]|uniref:Uncharacterized protein n=1 Tax=Ancylostoma duodenale TaxID=51022 RepID=A0A0C2DFT2_9BILA|nr:hypothetical protein ANCDUO_00830 [Ancylostoma duodenale]
MVPRPKTDHTARFLRPQLGSSTTFANDNRQPKRTKEGDSDEPVRVEEADQSSKERSPHRRRSRDRGPSLRQALVLLCPIS